MKKFFMTVAGVGLSSGVAMADTLTDLTGAANLSGFTTSVSPLMVAGISIPLAFLAYAVVKKVINRSR